MTIAFERTRSLIQAREFLQAMMDPKQTPRVPRCLRGKAKTILLHYPNLAEIEMAHKALPDEFGPVPPFSRMHAPTAITELRLDKINDITAAAAPLPGAR